MTKDDTAVFTLSHGIPSRPNTMTGGAWERERLLRRAALKLKDPCITARRDGSTTDGSISQKAGNLAAGCALVAGLRSSRRRGPSSCVGAVLGRLSLANTLMGPLPTFEMWLHEQSNLN